MCLHPYSLNIHATLWKTAKMYSFLTEKRRMKGLLTIYE